MKITIIVEKIPVINPTWVWSEREKPIYYCYRYSFIRYSIFRMLGRALLFETARSKLNSLTFEVSFDLGKELTPRQIYLTTLTSFYDGNVLEDEIDNAEDKEFEGNGIPNKKLISGIYDSLKNSEMLKTDVLLQRGTTKIVVPFLTSNSAFIYTLNDPADIADPMFEASIIHQIDPNVMKVFVIGLLDSSLYSIDF